MNTETQTTETQPGIGADAMDAINKANEAAKEEAAKPNGKRPGKKLEDAGDITNIIDKMNEDNKKTRGKGKGKGRRDNSGQEAVLKLDVLNDSMAKLLKLCGAQKDAAEDYSSAVKACGEKSGFNASVIRKLVAAKHGDKFDDVKKIVDQMGSAFELA